MTEIYINLFIPLSLFISSVTIFKSENPVYGVLSFVLVVAHIVLLLIALNLEFLAYTLAIVYIGAIVVLFLFVIMMFHIRINSRPKLVIVGVLEYFLIGFIATTIMYSNIFWCIFEYSDYAIITYSPLFFENIAFQLFNSANILITVAAALIMFTGVVGTILLTVREKNSTKVANISHNRDYLEDVLMKRK